MPGVPSGRGCEACRKQKKKVRLHPPRILSILSIKQVLTMEKCDLVQPSCSRCSRLQIACIGSGQRRFKFVGNRSVAAEPPASRALAGQWLQTSVPGIPLPPSNDLTMTTGAFCSVLSVTDVRYDLSVYGDCLKGIPMRLGSHPALDASVKTLTAAFTNVNSKQHSIEALSNYVKALNALRICFDDPAEAQSTNTMCAIYLISICQVSALSRMRPATM
jgi:hypothetical protein